MSVLCTGVAICTRRAFGVHRRARAASVQRLSYRDLFLAGSIVCAPTGRASNVVPVVREEVLTFGKLQIRIMMPLSFLRNVRLQYGTRSICYIRPAVSVVGYYASSKIESAGSVVPLSSAGFRADFP